MMALKLSPTTLNSRALAVRLLRILISISFLKDMADFFGAFD
jgi:hypothetical protein